MADRFLNLSEFARLAGVSPQMISKLVKGRLAPALVGGKIDTGSAYAIAYLSSRHPAHTQIEDSPIVESKMVKTEDNKQPQNSPEDPMVKIAATAANWSGIRKKISDRYGSDKGGLEYFKIVRAIEEHKMMQLKRAQKEGELIPRDMVKTHIYGMIDALFTRFLRDAPRTISTRCYALSKSGAPVEDAESLIQGIISQHLKGVVAKANRILVEKYKDDDCDEKK